MTLPEIGELLREAFPKRLLWFQASVEVDSCGKITPEIMIQDREAGIVECLSVADGVKSLKERIERLSSGDVDAADLGIPVDDDTTGDKP